MESINSILNTQAILTPDQAELEPRLQRSDDDYVIASLKKGLVVLEALKGQAYEAVTVREIARRTRFDYDFCRRALKTLKVSGWAIEDDNGWRLSVKAMQFSQAYWDWAMTLGKAV
ncbi:MAG TPA: hypothetical protein PLD20_00825 [Blastocatellia bacterium]|nr:hypothetical protein [Blastocatellia bacterium]HMV81790.1 hypothetical protein [Blastocatellia bacterium]HMX24730.1 hypothetical protein [Blastocatellia bacterium]HMY70689.1 hypothetical protein [Blastocatellia bacterium]HMZ16478.1 hypothetical protein [Blastocatellia bacterium]